jgi:hypothetical protein
MPHSHAEPHVREMQLLTLTESFTRQYSMSGLTHSAMLLGRVQGVVVHATKNAPPSPTTGKLTTHHGSLHS